MRDAGSIKNWTIVVLVIILILGIWYSLSLRDTNTVLNHNLNTATTEMRIIESSNNKLIYERDSYILEKKDLESKLNISKKEVKELEKKVGDLIYISNMDNSISIKDTIEVYIPITNNDSSFIYNFNNDTEWYNISGNILYNVNSIEHNITDINIPVSLQVGITEDWKIFVKSQNPYLNITSLDGALLNKDLYIKPKPKKWSLSIQTGMYVGIDIINKNFYVGPGIGVGISYNLFSW